MQRSETLEFSRVPVLSGSYRYSKLTPLEGSQPIFVDTTGGQTTTWELPSKVFNPAKSYIQFKISLGSSGATLFNYMVIDCLSLIRFLRVYPQSGNDIVNVEECATYTKLCWPLETPMDYFVTNDPTNMFYPSRVLQTQNKLSNGNNSAIPYNEQQHFLIGTLNAGGAQDTFFFNVPLSLLYGTFLSMNKDMDMDQLITMQLTYHPVTRWLSASTDPYTPSNTAYSGTPTGGAASQAAIYPYLFLALETNVGIV